ncbi:MAG: 2-oxoacid:acceptor oxidoreductase family protein, partial [Candidatus Methanomethyliaceae archaeon]|nr:2-oxoacid:acceptor oxidoreductase family protein [Candidatus Methanomethyliaceae archaeon]
AFGPERRGAPVLAFTRINDNEILLRTQIYEPDIVVVLDKSLCNDNEVGRGLKKNGIAVVNTSSSPEVLLNIFPNASKIATVDATRIAIEKLGVPVTNTAILGALIRATRIVKIETIENVLKEKFKGVLAEKNFNAVKEAYERTLIFDRGGLL